MFSSANLYNLFKPCNNPNLITDYNVIIGGTLLTADLDKGAIILNLVSNENITSQEKDFKNIIIDEVEKSNENQNDLETNLKGYIKEYSYIQSNFQVDFYKVNSKNAKVIEAELEAIKLREWLKSFETMEYLRKLNAFILPCYSAINFTSELYNKKFVNRAFFDFSIISVAEIKEEVGLYEKALLDIKLIIGG